MPLQKIFHLGSMPHQKWLDMISLTLNAPPKTIRVDFAWENFQNLDQNNEIVESWLIKNAGNGLNIVLGVLGKWFDEILAYGKLFNTTRYSQRPL